MTHDELLRKLKPKDIIELSDAAIWYDALIAVVNLHQKSRTIDGVTRWYNNDCVGCTHSSEPCATILAIEKVLK